MDGDERDIPVGVLSLNRRSPELSDYNGACTFKKGLCNRRLGARVFPTSGRKELFYLFTDCKLFLQRHPFEKLRKDNQPKLMRCLLVLFMRARRKWRTLKSKLKKGCLNSQNSNFRTDSKKSRSIEKSSWASLHSLVTKKGYEGLALASWTSDVWGDKAEGEFRSRVLFTKHERKSVRYPIDVIYIVPSRREEEAVKSGECAWLKAIVYCGEHNVSQRGPDFGYLLSR